MPYKRLCSYRDYSMAGLAHAVLVKHGLHPMPLDESAHVFIAGANQFYDIRVPIDEYHHGAKILRDIGLGNDVAQSDG